MISLRTALIIQSNNVICDAGGPDPETGKFAGWIMMDEERWSPLLNTEPIYSTLDDAKEAMENIVAMIKKADLSKEIDDLLSIYDEMGEKETIDFGSCCACGKEDKTVRNFVMLNVKGHIPGTGWGCVVCGIPADGATAVICDECVQRNVRTEEIKWVIKGYPLEKGRGLRSELTEYWDHNRSRHPEMDGLW